MTLCNAVISTLFSVSYLVLEFQTSGTKVSHNCDCPWSQYTYHALNYSFYITHWFQGIQLMASMSSSNSIGWVTPAFSRAICMTSCSSGGRAISPRRRLKYWLRPKWQISIVMILLLHHLYLIIYIIILANQRYLFLWPLLCPVDIFKHSLSQFGQIIFLLRMAWSFRMSLYHKPQLD